eukprot:542067-Prorocentrum_minimum.AAC.1
MMQFSQTLSLIISYDLPSWSPRAPRLQAIAKSVVGSKAAGKMKAIGQAVAKEVRESTGLAAPSNGASEGVTGGLRGGLPLPGGLPSGHHRGGRHRGRGAGVSDAYSAPPSERAAAAGYPDRTAAGYPGRLAPGNPAAATARPPSALGMTSGELAKWAKVRSGSVERRRWAQ